ncbi:Protein FAR1-like sequence 5 [Apostasia shenzhenica]|uniref:Protein FAR1-like sequence 5 n=1 Tax=Apostasia shenzhenica TaxID=1088818 RepID=A0A2I0A3M3_9ASPA|nr:Protein FAR1-like sequence 5 [Apostasia shenzhenica]
MVLISEISGNRREKAEANDEIEVKEETLLAMAETAPLEEEEEARNGAGPGGETLYDERALRVAQIMRSYLQMKQTAGSGSIDDHAELPAGHRCKAMMEVVLNDDGKWTISKLETEHSHPLCYGDGGDGGNRKVAIFIGMVFESVEDAKGFYYGYAEKMGFSARTGSNRRSALSAALIMQRFVCWRGSYPLQRRNSQASTGERKRGSYRRRDLEEKKGSDGNQFDVIEVDSSVEKGGVNCGESGVEVESMPFVKNLSSSANGRGVESHLKNGGESSTLSVSAQSKLLRELGVRVYRYSSDEKRDIILRYLMKKNNRQSGERTIKFFTTQPPIGENSEQQQDNQQEQEVRRNLIGRVELQGRVVARNPKQPIREVNGVVEEPTIGMVFPNEEKAFEFYVRYAGNIGFNVRKGWWDKTARSVTRLRVYVCSKEGFRPKGCGNETKKPRPETRTGCPARLAIKLTSNGRYCVSEFVSEHNHELAAPLDIQMFKSQKFLTKLQSGSSCRTKLIPADYKNYLRSKHMKKMQLGDAGIMVEYLQKMKGENSSFFYAIQVDEDDQLTNCFWADINSMMNYQHFGDVVCFDTTYKDADHERPFVQFIGVNHHKQTIIFGTAVLYDDSVESLKWLFDTFNTAMSGKQPMTVLTGECSAIGDAIAAVWPGTVHRYCVWHIYLSALKILSEVVQSTEAFSQDFSQCIFQFEEEEDFLTAWACMLEKYGLKDNDWMAKLYEERKKWALPYVQELFYGDIQNTLQRESLNIVLKGYLRPELDLLQLLKKYEEFLKEQRYMEQEADYIANQVSSRAFNIRLLWKAANVYTPAAFEMFRMEFELIPDCMVYSCGEMTSVSEYEVVKDKSKVYFVRYDASDGSIFCSCKKFEFIGIQCCHALRVLDCRNVKELSAQYFLKRWRKDAKSGPVRDDQISTHNNEMQSSLSTRYSSLCLILYKLAAKAAESNDAYAFMEGQSLRILEQVERIIHKKLLEKPPMTTASKAQSQSQMHSESIDHESNSESRRLSGKKKDGTGRRRHQTGIEMNKRYKGHKGKSDATEVLVETTDLPVGSTEINAHARDSSNQFFHQSQSVQGSYIPGHQFGLGSFHSFHATPQFTHESSAPVLQQSPFPGDPHLVQAPDMHALQFVASSSQLGPQGGDQGHYTIPVWDFL